MGRHKSLNVRPELVCEVSLFYKESIARYDVQISLGIGVNLFDPFLYHMALTCSSICHGNILQRGPAGPVVSQYYLFVQRCPEYCTGLPGYRATYVIPRIGCR